MATTSFFRNLRYAISRGHKRCECCANCGRYILPSQKSKPSGDVEMPEQHMRGACQRIDRAITAIRIDSMAVDATRVYMAQRAVR